MLSRGFVPFHRVDNFYGINSKDTSENMFDGEFDEQSINICSDPRGAIGSRPGYSSLTAASIGSATAWCGFYEFRKSTKTSHLIGGAQDGNIYKFETNSYVNLGSGLGSSSANDRFRFFQLDDICVILDGLHSPMKYSGVGSIATLGGTLCTADFGVEAWRYSFLHSTADPRLMYYCTTLGSVESGYTSFLNFDQDPYEITGGCRQGDDLLIFKLWSIFRVQYTGSVPKFTIEKIPSKVGTVCHDTLKELPDGKVIFLAPDFNVYMASGNDIIAVGDNIRKLLKDGLNSRLQYAVAGLNMNKSQYWLSYTYDSGASVNDITLVMDWSRPYTDKWGKLQYPWFVYSIGANCFAETYVNGKAWLYHGGYTGKMYKGDTGTNDDGSSFTSTYRSKMFSFGDLTLEKKYSKLFLAYQNKGDYDLNVTLVCDDNSNTQKNITQSMLGGEGYNSLWDISMWDVDYWSSESDIDVGRDIDRTGKILQVIMGTQGLDEAWNILNYTLLAKGLRRGVTRSREN